MGEIKIDAYAKINLSLDVVNRREDGYHELRMIMQQIDLKDVITIREINAGMVIESNSSEIPTNASNLVHKAWKILRDEYNIYKGIHVKIDKQIPVSAGLAGGSSDAAAVLKGLNKLWKLNIADEKLMEMGLKIGADVPYCIMGGTALAEGIGEKLTKIKDFSSKLILLAKPDISVSTAEVYTGLNLNNIAIHPNTDELIEYIKQDDVESLAKNMVNVLENVTVQKYSIIQQIKNDMIECGALGSLMSGSGPTVFGIFDDENSIIKCKTNLEKYLKTVHIVKTH